MPASYAHYRFGKLLLPTLPPDVRQCIQRFRRMYDVGLQGPDFFFYYNIFMKTPTGELGSFFHRQTGQEFFPAACKAAASEAAKAYLYGLLGHYCLDSTCHPFVNQLAAAGEAGHVSLESEFERFLLMLDRETSPHTFDRSKHFRLTRGECMTVAALYPGATGGKVFRSIRAMTFFTQVLARPGYAPFLRKVVPGLWAYSVPAQESPALAPHIQELHRLYGRALEQYPALLTRLTEHMQTGAPLGTEFAPNFG